MPTEYFNSDDLEKTGKTAPVCPKCDYGFMAPTNHETSGEFVHTGYLCFGCDYFIHIENVQSNLKP